MVKNIDSLGLDFGFDFYLLRYLGVYVLVFLYENGSNDILIL